MPELVPPHGSKNVLPLLSSGEEKNNGMKRAKTLKKVPLTSREISDLFMFGMGAYTPLKGFMNEAEWRSVCNDMRMPDGLFWPIPITLSVEVGTTTLKLRDLMRLSQGSVLELNRGVGEPMMVKINDTVIAKGEIVAVGDKLGISVTDIVAPLERVKPV